MRKKIIKNFVIFLGLTFASCVNQNDQQPPRIRIVDLQGKPHSVLTKVPELNSQAMASQNRQYALQPNVQNLATPSASEDYTKNSSAVTPIEAEDYGAASSQIIQKTLQPQQYNKQNQVSVPSNNNESIVGPSTVENRSSEVEYDLAQDYESVKETDAATTEKTITTKKKKAPEAKKSKEKTSKAKVGKVVPLGKVEKSSGRQFFVQVGSFSTMSGAKQTLSKMQKFHRGKIETVEGEKIIYRVLLGPMPNRAKTNEMVAKIKDSGQDAILVKF